MSDPTVIAAVISGGSTVAVGVIGVIAARSGRNRDLAMLRSLLELQAENRDLTEELEEEHEATKPARRRRPPAP